MTNRPTTEQAERFLSLFAPHSPRSYGEYREGANIPARTVKELPTPSVAQAHISGDVGLGLVPLLDDQCGWGVIDLDNHGSDDHRHMEDGKKEHEDLNILAMARKFANVAGATVTRSKSGGIHIYFFLSKPEPAKDVIQALNDLSTFAGFVHPEIFPKSSYLKPNGFGNWINLPYFNAEDTNRYAMKPNGERMSLDEFLSVKRATLNQLRNSMMNIHAGAPPCIEHLLYNSPPKGTRNHAIFNIALYFRKASPQDWEEKTRQYGLNMDDPLPLREINITIESAGSSDYSYKCDEVPLVDLCDKARCSHARYGLTEDEIEQKVQLVELKEQKTFARIEAIKKIDLDPPVFFLSVTGCPLDKPETPVTIEVSVKGITLTDFSYIRKLVSVTGQMILPPLKRNEWETLLIGLYATMTTEAPPDDITPAGALWARLVDYLTDTPKTETKEERDRAWSNDQAIRKDGEFLFSPANFVRHLEQINELKPLTAQDVYVALRKKTTQRKSRLCGQSRRVSAVAIDQIVKSKIERAKPTFEGEDF